MIPVALQVLRLTYRLMDASSVEALHRAFCSTWIIELNKSVVEAFVLVLLSKSVKDERAEQQSAGKEQIYDRERDARFASSFCPLADHGRCFCKFIEFASLCAAAISDTHA